MLNLENIITLLRAAPSMNKDSARVNRLFDCIYSANTYSDIPFEEFTKDDFSELYCEEFYEHLEKMYELKKIIRDIPRIQQNYINFI